ncbi:MAG: MEDS domain-containing protein [Spirochaetaceae bacterium]|nr:MEDS domain-containing protein [Spirochaetaceae bacterium]
MYLKTSELEKMNLGFGGHSCNWGTHIAGLYETEEERDQIITGFLSKGLEEKDLGLYAPVEQTAQDMKDKICQCCSKVKDLVDDEQYIQFYSAKALYYPEGTFSPQEMDDNLRVFYDDALSNGPRNIRATAEMAWALESIPGVEQLMVYESRLNAFISGKTWISICLYNLKRFSGDIIMEVFRTHPYVINKGVITENPFYEPPEIWLGKRGLSL